MKRRETIALQWSADFAYAIGLIATDGNLSIDGRHISVTSKDEALLNTFKKCINISNKLGKKARAKLQEKKYFVLQFGSMNFYEFLLSIGLTPAKSKTLGPLQVPNQYFAHFLRGCLDGDGCIDVRYHPESKYPQVRIRLYSASPLFLVWISEKLKKDLALAGGWISNANHCSVLTYATGDSVKVLSFIYPKGTKSYLERKYNIAKPFLADVAELV